MVRMTQNSSQNRGTDQPALSLLPPEEPQEDEEENEEKGKNDDHKTFTRSEDGDTVKPIIS